MICTHNSSPMSGTASPSVTQNLLAAARRPVDERTRRRAVLHWLDWIGCVAAGTRSPVGQVLRGLRATKPAAAGRMPAVPSLLGPAPDEWTATLLDAGPANVEEMDDMHRQAILHPGPVVIPALAGLARRGLPRRTVLDALVRGYEMTIRVGRGVGPRHYFHWHNTATAGAFGAAAACADAMGLPPGGRGLGAGQCRHPGRRAVAGAPGAGDVQAVAHRPCGLGRPQRRAAGGGRVHRPAAHPGGRARLLRGDVRRRRPGRRDARRLPTG
jgi:hypothetical protein